MEILSIMGQRLKELRKEKRAYQREMAELLDITLRHYQKIENGEVNISALTLCDLAVNSSLDAGHGASSNFEASSSVQYIIMSFFSVFFKFPQKYTIWKNKQA